jgi:hypothetical protein
MANVVGDIAIKVGADIGPLVRDLSRAKGEVSSFGAAANRQSASMASVAKSAGIAAGAVLAAGTALAAFTKAAMDNIDALSKQARVAGVSVASFQAMKLVAEEAGVSGENLSKIIVKLQDNIATLGQGGATQAEAFNRLGLSFAELGQLSPEKQLEAVADAISAIQDPAARTSAAIDVFGKSGANAINMLGGFGAAAENARQFQAAFGLAVSDVDAQQIERANDAMGRLKMATDGLGIALAVAFSPAIEQASNAMVAWITSLTGAQAALDELLGNADRARVILGDDITNALLQSRDTILDNVNVLGDLSYAYEALSRDVSVAVGAMAGDIAYLIELGFDDLAIQLDDVSSRMIKLQGDFDAGRISAEEFESGMDAAISRAGELLAEANRINGVDMSGAIGQVGLLAKALAIARGVAQSLRAALPGGSAALVDDRGAAIAESRAGAGGFNAPTTSPRPRTAPNNIDFGLPDFSGGGGGGGGGGGSNANVEALARMREEFATEMEQIQIQYEEKLAKLREFREQKLLTEQEFNDLEAKLKQEHEDKLSEIEASKRRERLLAFSGAFGDLATLMQSGNAKLFKIGQAAAIAEAVVSGYQAAVDAWQKGMKVGGPGVAAAFTAASLAKTGMLIAKIKSSPPSGSGGGAGAVGSAGVAASAPQSIANITLNGDTFSRGTIEGLFEQINDGLRQGRVINLVRA